MRRASISKGKSQTCQIVCQLFSIIGPYSTLHGHQRVENIHKRQPFSTLHVAFVLQTLLPTPLNRSIQTQDLGYISSFIYQVCYLTFPLTETSLCLEVPSIVSISSSHIVFRVCAGLAPSFTLESMVSAAGVEGQIGICHWRNRHKSHGPGICWKFRIYGCILSAN